MPTKQQLEQQLEETRADLEALHVRNSAQIRRGDELESKLREARAMRESAEKIGRHHHDRVISLEADVARLGGMIEGMRYMIRLDKGIEPHADPLPSSDGGNPFENLGQRFSDIAKGLRG